jgi:hypothetical protein
MKIFSGQRYKHYKGNEYLVIAIAKNESTLEDVVVYQDVEDAKKIWVRSVKIFLEEVVSEEYNYTGPRFVLISD